MGRFKRNQGKKKRRGVVPEKWDSIASLVKKALKLLVEEGKIQSYQTLGPRMNNSMYSFEVLFPFWIRSATFNIFVSQRNDKECAIRQGSRRKFDFLIGSGVEDSEIKNQIQGWISIMESGLSLETTLIEKLNEHYKASGINLSVEKASQHEDMHKKFDIVVKGYKKPLGIQIKKRSEDWIHHRNAFPDVPSILAHAHHPGKTLASAVEQIATSRENGFIEHINLLIKKPPS